MRDPILHGEEYHKCGPVRGNFSRCSTLPADWTIPGQPDNGPCCSENGFCGRTHLHCDYPGVDFREVISDNLWDFKRGYYVPEVVTTTDGNSIFTDVTLAQLRVRYICN